MVNPRGPLEPLSYGRQTIDEDDIAAVERVLRSSFLTQGPAIDRFEEALCIATGAKYAVAVANGTAALHLAALAAGVREGDIGITPSITFVASANAIRYAGGTVRFADVDPATSLISIPSLEARIAELGAEGRKPRVIVPVDMTGQAPDLAALGAIAKRLGAVVIEDAAHSLGGSYRDPTTGEFVPAASCRHADMAILSFHPVKTVTTGEGGAITTNDEALFRELRDLRTHGITKDPTKLERVDGPWYYEQRTLGFNYRMTDIQAALGTSQLGKLARFVARRREIAARYDAAFAAHADRVHPLGGGSVVAAADRTSAYHLYVVRVARRRDEDLVSLASRRKALYLALAEKKIFAQVHYIPVHAQPDFRRHGMGNEHLPGADEYYASCLSLPMFPAMSDADVDRVVNAVLESV